MTTIEEAVSAVPAEHRIAVAEQLERILRAFPAQHRLEHEPARTIAEIADTLRARA